MSRFLSAAFLFLMGTYAFAGSCELKANTAAIPRPHYFYDQVIFKSEALKSDRFKDATVVEAENIQKCIAICKEIASQPAILTVDFAPESGFVAVQSSAKKFLGIYREGHKEDQFSFAK